MAREISKPERNAVRDFNNSREKVDKYLYPQDATQVQLRQAKKHVDQCRKAWDTWDQIFNQLVDDMDDGDEYDAALAEYDTKLREDYAWLEKAEKDYDRMLQEKDIQREQQKISAEMKELVKKFNTTFDTPRTKISAMLGSLPPELQPAAYNSFHQRVLAIEAEVNLNTKPVLERIEAITEANDEDTKAMRKQVKQFHTDVEQILLQLPQLVVEPAVSVEDHTRTSRATTPVPQMDGGSDADTPPPVGAAAPPAAPPAVTSGQPAAPAGHAPTSSIATSTGPIVLNVPLTSQSAPVSTQPGTLTSQPGPVVSIPGASYQPGYSYVPPTASLYPSSFSNTSSTTSFPFSIPSYGASGAYPQQSGAFPPSTASNQTSSSAYSVDTDAYLQMMLQQQQARMAAGHNTRAQSFTYAKRAWPKFTGNIRQFPRWLDEWMFQIAPNYSDSQMVDMLDEHTPEDIKLSHCSSLNECWQRLISRYSNPAVIASSLIKEFLNYKPDPKWSDSKTLIQVEEFTAAMLKDLTIAHQEGQITNNQLMVDTLVLKLPVKYREKLVEVRMENDRAPAHLRKPVWNLVWDYIKSTKVSLEANAPWLCDETGGEDEKSGGEKGKKFCNKCRKHHKPDNPCPSPSTKQISAIEKKAAEDKMKEAWKKYGPCPVCQGNHSFKAKDGNTVASSRLYDCKKWKESNIDQKIKLLKDCSGCAACTSWTHQRDACNSSYAKCGHKDSKGDVCKEKHYRAFHGQTNSYVNLIHRLHHLDNCDHDVTLCDHGHPAMLFMQHVDLTRKISTTLFTDTGSNTSLITHDLADRLKLKGYPTVETLQLASKADPEVIETKLYKYTLTANDGTTKKMTLMGVNQITTLPKPANVSDCYQLFPHVPKEALDRPTLPVEILIGMDNAEFMPSGGGEETGNRVGGLQCMQSKFGTGWVLGGKHDTVKDPEVMFSDVANIWRMATITTSKRSVPRSINHLAKAVKAPIDLDFDDLGVRLPPLCKKCESCTHCTLQRNDMTREEREVYDIVKKGMEINEDGHYVTAKYPVNDNVYQLQDNMSQAIKRAESVEKSLRRMKLLDQYNEQLTDSINRGAQGKVTREEIDDRVKKGLPVHFIGHHGVLNPGSKSTPLRKVSDSSMKNNYTGPSLNNCIPKGPNSLTNLLEVLYRWRSYPVAIVLDLAKAYHTIRTGEMEKFIRLEVWRWGDPEKEWEIFGYLVVAFGDLVASLILEIAKELASELGEKYGLDPEAVLKIIRDFYVDDGVTGSNKKGAEKLIGDMTVGEDGKLSFSGTFSQVLALAGFRPKAMIRSGENPPEVLEKLGKVLGHDWDPLPDQLKFKFELKVNLKDKRMNVDLTLDNLNEVVFTRRKCLGFSSQFYDPMGLCCAVTIRYKIAMKDLVVLNPGWDEVLPDKFQKFWRTLVAEMLTSPPVVFPRAIIPPEPVGYPELCCYWDGSDSAYACVVYCRWPLNQDYTEWQVRLYGAKARVTPSDGLTTPRSELCGLLILTRLLMVIVHSMDTKPRRLTLIGDSECTISSYDAVTSILNPYFGNRITEANHNLKQVSTLISDEITAKEELTETKFDEEGKVVTLLDKLYHTPGEINISDLATRGTARMEDIGPESEWQQGPDYLLKPRSTWPLSRSFVREIPAEEKRSKVFKLISAVDSVHQEGVLSVLHKTDNYDQARGTIARIISAELAKVRDTIYETPTPELYEKAEQAMFWVSMPLTSKMQVEGKLDNLSVFWEGNICYTQGRIPELSAKRVLGKPKLVVLSPNSKVAYMIMKKSHEEDHKRLPIDAVARSRKYAYIVRAKGLARKVIKNCGHCKVIQRIYCEQKMAQLPPQIFEAPVRPFTNICLDFTGAFMVRSMTNKRRFDKVFPLVIVCLNTSAVHFMVCGGYSTSDFLIAFETYMAVRGEPRWVYCDSGSQLIAASKAFKEREESGEKEGAKDYYEREKMNVSWPEVLQKTAHKGIEWRVAPPGAQHRDGRSEKAVEALKRSLKHLHASRDINLLEFQMLLAKAASCVNDRPLDIYDVEEGEPAVAPLTPNLLLMNTRAGSVEDPLDKYEDAPDRYVVRLKLLQRQYEAWWDHWYKTCFQNLIPYKKWKHAKKNLSVDDVCLLRYQGKIGPGDYRLCRVVETFPDDQNLVRTVRVVVAQPNTKSPKLLKDNTKLRAMTVPIQRLVLIASKEIDDTAEDEKDAVVVNAMRAWPHPRKPE